MSIQSELDRVEQIFKDTKDGFYEGEGVSPSVNSLKLAKNLINSLKINVDWKIYPHFEGGYNFELYYDNIVIEVAIFNNELENYDISWMIADGKVEDCNTVCNLQEVDNIITRILNDYPAKNP